MIISNFDRQPFNVNEALMSKNLFLRVYELRKFRYLIHKAVTTNEVIRDLFERVVEKISGFEIIKTLMDEKIKREYRPIHVKDKIVCFLTKSIHKAYRTTFSIDKKGTIGHTNAYECYGCSQVFDCKDRFDADLKICSKSLESFTTPGNCWPPMKIIWNLWEIFLLQPTLALRQP